MLKVFNILNIHTQGEIMFTIDTVVDQSVRNAKQFSTLIQDKNTRAEYEKLIDAQAEYVKTSFKTVTELTATFVKNFDAYKLVKEGV